MTIKLLIKKYKLRVSHGFTVLETIVAIGIVSLAIAGTFSAVRTGLVTSINAKDEIRAFYLSQEAIEILRNKRDNNKLIVFNGGSASWLSGIADIASDPCYPGKTCIVDATLIPMALTTCAGGWGTCPPINYSSVNSLYGYDASWTATKYTREIQIEKNDDDEVAVIINISWMQGLNNRQIKVKTLLSNWF